MSVDILIVEDNDLIRTGLAQLFRLEGYRVETAIHGQDALEILSGGEKPHLILLDLFMPVVDGWNFRKAQLSDPSIATIPVVVLTCSELTREELEELKVNDTLIKPVNPEALFDLAREYTPPSMISV